MNKDFKKFLTVVAVSVLTTLVFHGAMLLLSA